MPQNSKRIPITPADPSARDIRASMHIKCSLGRRLAAVVYDSLLLLAVLFIANWLLLILLGPEQAASLSRNPLIYIYYSAVALLFYGWFWTHGGQTLGMRVWRVQLIAEYGGAVSWSQAAIRFGVALLSWGCVGAGFLWALLDSENRGWHDLVSRSRLVVLPKQ